MVTPTGGQPKKPTELTPLKSVKGRSDSVASVFSKAATPSSPVSYESLSEPLEFDQEKFQKGGDLFEKIKLDNHLESISDYAPITLIAMSESTSNPADFDSILYYLSKHASQIEEEKKSDLKTKPSLGERFLQTNPLILGLAQLASNTSLNQRLKVTSYTRIYNQLSSEDSFKFQMAIKDWNQGLREKINMPQTMRVGLFKSLLWKATSLYVKVTNAISQIFTKKPFRPLIGRTRTLSDFSIASSVTLSPIADVPTTLKFEKQRKSAQKTSEIGKEQITGPIWHGLGKASLLKIKKGTSFEHLSDFDPRVLIKAAKELDGKKLEQVIVFLSREDEKQNLGTFSDSLISILKDPYIDSESKQNVFKSFFTKLTDQDQKALVEKIAVAKKENLEFDPKEEFEKAIITGSKSLEQEKTFAQILHPGIDKLIQADIRQKLPKDLSLLTRLMPLKNYKLLQESFLNKLTQDDARDLLKQLAESQETINPLIISSDFLARLQLLFSDSSTSPLDTSSALMLLKKLDDNSNAFTSIFNLLPQTNQDEILQAIKSTGDASEKKALIEKFEKSVLEKTEGSIEQIKHFEEKVLKAFYPSTLDALQNFQTLDPMKRALVVAGILKGFKGYVYSKADALNKLTRNDIDFIVSHFDKIQEKLPITSFVSQSFLLIAERTHGTSQTAKVFEKVYKLEDSSISEKLFGQILSLKEGDKQICLEYVLKHETLNPRLLLECIKRIPLDKQLNPKLYELALEKTLFATSLLKSQGEAVMDYEFSRFLQDDPRLNEVFACDIELLNKPLESFDDPHELKSLIFDHFLGYASKVNGIKTQLASIKETLTEASKPPFDSRLLRMMTAPMFKSSNPIMNDFELEGQKTFIREQAASRVASPEARASFGFNDQKYRKDQLDAAEKSIQDLELKRNQDLAILKTLEKFFDPLEKKYLTAEEFIKAADTKIIKLESALSFLQSVKSAQSHIFAKDHDVKIFEKDLNEGRMPNISSNPDYLSLSTALYGGSFLKNIILNRNFIFGEFLPNIDKLSKTYDFEKFKDDFKAFNAASKTSNPQAYQAQQKAFQDLNSIITDAKKIMNDDPLLALALFDKGLIKEEELFAIVVSGSKDSYQINDLLITKLDKEKLAKLRRYLVENKPYAKDALSMVNINLGYDFLFLPQDGVNRELLKRMNADELFEASRYMIENYPQESEALTIITDQLALTRYLENKLHGDDLVNAIYNSRHVNQELLSKIADENILRAVLNKLPLLGFSEVKALIKDRLS